MKYSIGVDIGGTKVLSALMDNTGKVHETVEIPSDIKTEETLFQSVTSSVNMLLEKSGKISGELEGIGVGVPGFVDTDKGVAVYQSNIPWENFNVSERLSEVFKVSEIKVDNDVAMAGYHAFKMVGSPGETVIYITVSTGMACAVIHDGIRLSGHGFSGELGHVIVEWDGEHRRLEHIVSGTGIGRLGREIFGDDTLKAEDVFKKYDNGDPEALKIIETTAELFAKNIYTLIALMDPHKIVFGGSVMVHQPAYLEMIKEKMTPFMLQGHMHILDNMTVTEGAGIQGAAGAAMSIFK